MTTSMLTEWRIKWPALIDTWQAQIQQRYESEQLVDGLRWRKKARLGRLGRAEIILVSPVAGMLYLQYVILKIRDVFFRGRLVSRRHL